LNNLAKSFGFKLDSKGNSDGKIGLNEFTKFFKNIMKTKYAQMTDKQIEGLARKAWDNINITKSGTDELDLNELTAFVATVDAGGTLDGKIDTAELVDILDKLANDDAQTLTDIQNNHTTYQI
jgi:Ca2+-binding EF-hand superfamily protein